MDRLPLEDIQIHTPFSTLLDRLNSDEYAQLQESIETHGITDPLVLWGSRNILIDGHNRYEIAQNLDHADVPVTRIEIDTERDAKIWIIKHQLGRRNLSPSRLSFFRGQLAIDLGTRGAAAAADVNDRTIRRDRQFATAVNTVAQVDPDLADDILADRLPRSTARQIADSPDPARTASAIRDSAGQQAEGEDFLDLTQRVGSIRSRMEVIQRSFDATCRQLGRRVPVQSEVTAAFTNLFEKFEEWIQQLHETMTTAPTGHSSNTPQSTTSDTQSDPDIPF